MQTMKTKTIIFKGKKNKTLILFMFDCKFSEFQEKELSFMLVSFKFDKKVDCTQCKIYACK